MKQKAITLLALVFCSYLPADAYLENATPPMEPQNELEHLTVILAKYGNNPENIQAINYAILQNDEAAIDLLLRYGASFGRMSPRYAIKVGNLDLFKRIFDNGVRIDSYENGLLLSAIAYHHNDIARYLIEQGNTLGFDVLEEDRDYLKACETADNIEIYNLLTNKGYRFK